MEKEENWKKKKKTTQNLTFMIALTHWITNLN